MRGKAMRSDEVKFKNLRRSKPKSIYVWKLLSDLFVKSGEVDKIDNLLRVVKNVNMSFSSCCFYLLSFGCVPMNESKEPLCVREVWVCTLGSSLPESVVESGPR